MSVPIMGFADKRFGENKKKEINLPSIDDYVDSHDDILTLSN